MKTPREIILRHHQASSPKLDAIRVGVVAGIAPKTFSWREMALSLRWHLTGLGAAWMVIIVLNTDASRGGGASIPRDNIPSSRQIWASVRESRRLLLQYTDLPAAEPPAPPGRRSEVEMQQTVV